MRRKTLQKSIGLEHIHSKQCPFIYESNGGRVYKDGCPCGSRHKSRNFCDFKDGSGWAIPNGCRNSLHKQMTFFRQRDSARARIRKGRLTNFTQKFIWYRGGRTLRDCCFDSSFIFGMSIPALLRVRNAPLFYSPILVRLRSFPEDRDGTVDTSPVFPECNPSRSGRKR